MKATIRAFLLLLACAVVLGGLAAYAITGRGLSTRVEPSAVEASIALTMRRLATPRAVRDARNRVEATPGVVEVALAHFADHCATCHANDDGGATDIGRNFCPPAPDMPAARRQSLADGELLSIIENGIRLTGMEDVVGMESMNPRSPQQFRDEEARRFLAGEDTPARPAPEPAHKHQ